MSRLLPNWLQGYADYIEESESPENYHLWTALSVLASVLRRQVFIHQGIYVLYPNLFVVLIGPPGKTAKSTAIRLGRNLLYAVEDIEFGPDSVTREELIRLLGKSAGTGKSAALTLHSTELSSLIEPSGIKMVQFLTDIFDNDEKWRYSTKSQGKDVIVAPVINLLAGTTPSWIAEGMPANFIDHGFASRTIFVYEEEPRKMNPFPDKPNEKLVAALKNDLVEISRLEGEFTYEPGARELYEKYYEEIHKTNPRDYRISGFHWRKKIHILKVAMLLSVSQDDSLVVRARDIETAAALVKSVERNMPRAFSAVGKYEHASDLERIYAQILEAGQEGLSSAEVYERNYAVGDVRQLAGIIQMLISMSKIERVRLESGGVRYIAVD